MIYPQFQADWTISATSSLAAEIAFGVGALGSIAYCVNVGRRERKWWPLWVILGSMLTMLWEPFTDLLLDCGYPRGPRVAVNLFGHDIPLYIFFVYVFYFAPAVTWLYLRLEKGTTQRQFWKYSAVMVLTCAVFEPLPTALGWWRYWGNQPLNFTGLPMHWWFTDATCVVAVPVAMHLIRKYLLNSEGQTWIFVPLMLPAVWASKCADIPLVWVMSNTESMPLRTLASLSSIAISVALLWGMARAVAVDWHPASDHVPARTAAHV
jgi:hypothetical protein